MNRFTLLVAVIVGVGCKKAESPLRTALTRPLAGTSTQSLLFDPFVTTDTTWGHFNTILVSAEKAFAPKRALLSDSPVGLGAPVVKFAPSSTVADADTLQALEPLTGSTQPLLAKVWLTAKHADGTPFDAATLAAGITVELLPNDQPAMTFPLTANAATVKTFGDVTWVQLALADAAPLTAGGWFSITITDPNAEVWLQAPEVVPATMDMRRKLARPQPYDSARRRRVTGAYRALAANAPSVRNELTQRGEVSVRVTESTK